MSQTVIPTILHDITPEWLTDAFSSTQVITKERVESVSVESLAEGMGMSGQLGILKINYSKYPSDGPATVFCKLPSIDQPTFNRLNQLGFYEREVRFYEEMAHNVPIRTPRCYYSQFDVHSGKYILILEDLNLGHPGDQVAGCTPHQAELVVIMAAKLHSKWWNSSSLDQNPSLVPWSTSADHFEKSYRRSLEIVLDKYGKLITPEMKTLCERVTPHIVAMRRANGEPPQTLVHGDFRLDNIMFGADEDDFDIALVDWQLYNSANGMIDIAHFISGSLETDARREQESHLLDVYYATLVANGVEDYTKESCIRDYKLGLLDRIDRRIVPWSQIDFSSDRGQRLIEVFFSRFSSALIDNNVEDLIPSV